MKTNKLVMTREDIQYEIINYFGSDYNLSLLVECDEGNIGESNSIQEIIDTLYYEINNRPDIKYWIIPETIVDEELQLVPEDSLTIWDPEKFNKEQIIDMLNLLKPNSISYSKGNRLVYNNEFQIYFNSDSVDIFNLEGEGMFSGNLQQSKKYISNLI